MLYTKRIENEMNFDVAVLGGGFSGFAAAYSAAREGARVVLVERGAVLGGVGTHGLVNHILGARAFVGDKYKTCIAGLFGILEKRLVENGAAVDVDTIDFDLNPHGWKRGLGLGLIFDNEYMRLELERMLSEVNVDILYYTEALDVIKNDSRIDGVIIHNKSGFSLIRAKCFVDATGDGDIYDLCGEDSFFGDDEGGLAAASLEMHVENVDTVELTEYMRQTGDVRFKDIIERLKANGKWEYAYEIFISVLLTKPDVYMINTIRQVGIDGTCAKSLTRGTIDGREENYRLLETMRAYFPGFKNACVRQIAQTIGIRETRRLCGRYVLGVSDVIEGVRFEDSIAVSGYGWDMPNPKNPSYQPYHSVKRKSSFTEIPYRSLLPKKTDNLIVVGRCISAEREVLGVVRVMGPCIAMGEAAGLAAELAIDKNKSFAEVDVKELKERIIRRGGITGVDEIE